MTATIDLLNINDINLELGLMIDGLRMLRKTIEMENRDSTTPAASKPLFLQAQMHVRVTILQPDASFCEKPSTRSKSTMFS